MGLNMRLEDCYDKHGCDKSSKHGYHMVYESYFDKEKPLKILEVGIFKGESIKAHLDYLPNAELYGIDIFERLQPSDVKVLEDKRVHWIKANSMEGDVSTLIKKSWGDIKFDIIIDDGAHWPKANLLTLKNLVPFLKEDGHYFIEDVWPLEKMSEAQRSSEPWLRYPRYNLKDNQELLDYLDENYRIGIHDLRHSSGCGDSYIINVQYKYLDNQNDSMV